MDKRKERSEEESAPEAQHYVIRGRIDLSQVKDLDRTVPLRVAAVRDDQVLHSEVVTLEGRKDLAIDFDLNFRVPGRLRRPCGFHLMISRGDLRADEILGIEGVRRWIPAREWKTTAGHNPFTVDVGSLVVSDLVYRGWLTICRRYTIRGRVVCRRWFFDPRRGRWVMVDNPVPGATVEAFDVDCWWWWCFRDQIDTAVTDVNGNFEIRFTWCCRRWFPLPRPWVIDPDLLRRIRELLAKVKLPIPLPDPPPVDPVMFEQYLGQFVGSATAGAPTLTTAQWRAAPDPAAIASPSAQILRALLPAAPDLEALHVWPWWHRRDCAPDVSFKVTQPCGGVVRVIYEESTAQTRWNIPQALHVTLEANNRACCLPQPPDPPCGDCAVFTWVGCVRTDSIGTDAGPPDLRGYAYPNTQDRPFAESLRVRGDFGEDAQSIVDYYRLEYHKDGMAPGTWIDTGSVAGLLGSVSRSYWDHAAVAFSPAVPFGPSLVDGRVVYKTRYKFERDNPGAPSGNFIWDDWDTLFAWNTANLPEGDGLYTVRLIGYRQAADGKLVDERIMPLCGTEDDQTPTPATIIVRVDNQNVPHAPSVPAHPCGPGTVHACTAEPDCDVVSVVKNEGMAGQATINPCDIVTIADTDTVTIHFNATVPATTTDGHLDWYTLTAHYGESSVFSVLAAGTLSADPTVHVGPTYAAALTQGPPGSIARPLWHGGNYKVTVPGSAFPVSCAYLLQLRARKRTLRGGCSYPVHENVTEYSFCVIKP